MDTLTSFGKVSIFQGGFRYDFVFKKVQKSQNCQNQSLQEDEQRVKEDVGCCEGEVRQHSNGLPLAVARLRRRPEQRVDRVLPEGRKQTVADLKQNRE